MSATEMNWVLVTDAPLSLDWPDNHLLDLEVDDKKITLAKFKDGYFAFAQKCPHASGRMAQGYINPLGQVVCPLHSCIFFFVEIDFFGEDATKDSPFHHSGTLLVEVYNVFECW